RLLKIKEAKDLKGDWEFLKNAGKAFTLANQFQDASDYYEQASTLAPVEQRFEIYLDLTSAYHRLAEWKKAEDTRKKALALAPPNKRVEVLRNMTTLFISAKNWDKAFQTIDRAIGLASGNEKISLLRTKASNPLQAANQPRKEIALAGLASSVSFVELY